MPARTAVLPLTTTATPEPVRSVVALIALLGALTALAPLTIDLYLPAFPTIEADFATTESAVQMTLTGSLIGVALGQLIIGPLSDAYGRRPPLLFAVVGYVLASIGCAVAPTVELLGGARVLQGMAAAAGGVIAMAVIRDLFDGLRGVQMLSRLILVVGVAPIIAPTVGSVVLAFTHWRGVFWLLAVVGVVLAVAGMIGMRETLPAERRQPAGIRPTLRTYGRLLRERTMVGLLLTGGFVFAQIFAYVSGSSFVLQNQYGLTTSQFGLVFGLNSLGLVIMSQVNPVLLRSRDPQDVLSIALVVGGVATVLLLVATTTGALGLAGILIPLFVILSMAGLSLPNVPGLALATHGRTAGSAAALLGGANFAVGAVVAPLVGVLPVAPATSMAVVMAAMSAAALTAYFWVARPGRIPAFDRVPAPAGSDQPDVEELTAEVRAPSALVPEPVGCGVRAD